MKKTRRFQYYLTEHAQRVLAEREIPVGWIEQALFDPEKTEEDKTDANLVHALKSIGENGNRVLRVVYNKTAIPKRIVTAFFGRRVRS